MTDRTKHPAKNKSARGRPKTAADLPAAPGSGDQRAPTKAKPGAAPPVKAAPGRRMTAEDLKRTIGTSDPSLTWHLLVQALNARTLFAQATESEKEVSFDALLAALKGIAPQNEMEGMLAVQMVSTHNAAMECLRRAMIPDQTLAGRDFNLKHAAKLMSLYVQQLEALDRRRGKGQQRITVEHVNVHAGGQAIVGAVQAPALAAASSPPVAPAALPDRSGEAMPLIEARATEKVPSKSRSR